MNEKQSHFVILVLFLVGIATGAKWTIPVENWYSTVRGNISSPTGFGAQAEATFTWGTEYGLTLDGIPDDLEINLEFYDNEFQVAKGVDLLIQFQQAGLTLSGGNPLSDVLVVTGQAAAVYDVAQVSGTSTASALSDKSLYPFVTRNYVPSPFLTNGVVGTILSFIGQGLIGWNQVALLCSTDGFGVSMANGFLNEIQDTPIEIATFQQFLIDSVDHSVEIQEIVRSGARVIVTFAFGSYAAVLAQADEAGLLDDHHVFFAGSVISGFASTYSFPNGTVDPLTVERMRGTIACQSFLPRLGPVYDQYAQRWQSADPAVVPGSGEGTTPPLFPTLVYDSGISVVLAVAEAERQGFTPESPPTGQEWSDILRSLTFEGVTGFVEYESNGDRPMPVALVNFRPETLKWENIAVWTEAEGVIFSETNQIIWSDNTTNIPDLDIRPAFDYWSCSSKETKTDKTGKEISLHTPDGSSFDDIDIDYHCDQFIDCHNLSDESYDCSSNYTALFIAFGIITLMLILIALLLLLFVIVFGVVLKYRRLRTASPTFLVILLVSVIIGFSSVFAFYGKPHPVACGFQPWLLGLPAISMIAALSVKTLRIYRIFRIPAKKTRISDFELLIYWIAVMIPGVLIVLLWTIISTPTAAMEERNGEDHYVCTTGGFTGSPGGLVFFFIFVAYSALVLVIGAIISFLARDVPSLFNETKLLTISIYNLGFLSAVIIPVFLVVNSINPFIAWILRTVAVLYAFSATMFLQFVPKVIGIFLIDKGRNIKVFKQMYIKSSMNLNTVSKGSDSVM